MNPAHATKLILLFFTMCLLLLILAFLIGSLSLLSALATKFPDTLIPETTVFVLVLVVALAACGRKR
jgi:uncharacterized membrane protein YqjE